MSKAYEAVVRPGSEKGVGVWTVELDPLTGGPYTITAYQEGQTIAIKDVLFGDVWVCSGQSNMRFATGQVNMSLCFVCVCNV